MERGDVSSLASDRRESPLPRLLRALPPVLRRHKLISTLGSMVPRWRVATFRFNGSAWIIADLADSAPRQALITGRFEPEFFAITRPFVAAGSAVFDGGANAGFCTFGLAATTAPAEQVSFHLFEANGHLCEVQRRAAALYPGLEVVVNHACLAATAGESTLQVVCGHWGGSFIGAAEVGTVAQPVPNLVLDDYIRERSVHEISLLKLDLEGHEPEALSGLSRSLAAGQVGAIYCEVSPPSLARYGRRARHLLQLLRELGCELFWCKPTDLVRLGPSSIHEVEPQPGRGTVRLAQLESYPEDLQTDLVAIPRAGRFAPLLAGLR